MPLQGDLARLADTAQLSSPFVAPGQALEAGSDCLTPARGGHLRAFAIFGPGAGLAAPGVAMRGPANMACPADWVDDEALAAARRLASRTAASVMTARKPMRAMPALLARWTCKALLSASA